MNWLKAKAGHAVVVIVLALLALLLWDELKDLGAELYRFFN